MKIATEDQDPQRDGVYYAESAAREILADTDRFMSPAELPGFVGAALTRAGWEVGPAPVVALDVADDAEWAGWHEAATGVIHLHPRLLSPWTVLHELAHWVDPRGGHGDRFCANYVELVAATLGHDAARELVGSFVDNGVAIDETWLADSLRTTEGL